MLKILPIFVLPIILLTSCFNARNESTPLKVAEIQEYEVKLPNSLIKASGGFYPGIGSGIEFKQKYDNGKLEFIAISDRGPNFPLEDDKKIVVFYPNFSPKIVKIEVEPQVKAEVKSYMSIKYHGHSITGLNINQDEANETIYDANLNKIAAKFGLDTESISMLKMVTLL